MLQNRVIFTTSSWFDSSGARKSSHSSHQLTRFESWFSRILSKIILIIDLLPLEWDGSRHRLCTYPHILYHNTCKNNIVIEWCEWSGIMTISSKFQNIVCKMMWILVLFTYYNFFIRNHNSLYDFSNQFNKITSTKNFLDFYTSSI